MTVSIHLGISTCPNDTFAFHGLLQRKVDWRGLEFRVELLDVEQLNQALFAGSFDVAKASFHAALLLSDEVDVLSSGSALGFGVGPLLLSAREGTRPDDLKNVSENPLKRGGQPQFAPKTPQNEPVPGGFRGSESGASPGLRAPIVLCPGRHTTATLLYKMFFPNCGNIRQVVFSEIMPALAAGQADFGVCIHEGRFTYEEQGLSLVEDLGTRWEQATSTPLPLGGIVARKLLGRDTLSKVQHVVRDSLEYGLSNRQETLETMRRHAQELDDEVIFAHVDLYVNAWTRELGETGGMALRALADRAASSGIVPAGHGGLDIVEA